MNLPQNIDIGRYMGLWYEIARLPNRFQKQCMGNVTAAYSPLQDGRIRVLNRCKKKDGSYSEAEGIAMRADKDGGNAKLKVSFAPAWLSWLSVVWGNYWILDLAKDYSYALVGEPSRTYLWVLSRTKTMDDKVYATLIERARTLGFDTAKVVKTIQE